MKPLIRPLYSNKSGSLANRPSMFRLLKCFDLLLQVLNEILEFHRAFPEKLFQEIKAKPLPSLADYPINE